MDSFYHKCILKSGDVWETSEVKGMNAASRLVGDEKDKRK